MENNIDNVRAGNGGWVEWGKYVLKELEHLQSNIKEIRNKLDDINEELIKVNVKVSALETKAMMWGALVSFVVTTVVMIAINFFNK